MSALACALTSAILFVLALGTPDTWPLAWVAPVPLLWLAFGDASWPRVMLAAVLGYALGELGMLWPYLGAMGALVLVVALGPAIVFAAVVLMARFAARRLPPIAATLAFPALWTGWEWTSATLSPHGTFGAWAYSQTSAPVMVQSASLLGPWIVSFLVALVASGIALALRRRTLAPLVVALVPAMANVAFGAARLAAHDDGATIRVAAAARDHDDTASSDSVAAMQSAEARRLAARGARVIVFEEKVALLPAGRRDAVLSPLVWAARETGATIVAGYEVTGAEHRNAAFTIGADGSVRTYTKRHHIPRLEREFTIGDGPGLLGGGAAVAICKDMDFQRTLRGDVLRAEGRGGVGVMFVPA